MTGRPLVTTIIRSEKGWILQTLSLLEEDLEDMNEVIGKEFQAFLQYPPQWIKGQPRYETQDETKLKQVAKDQHKWILVLRVRILVMLVWELLKKSQTQQKEIPT